MSLSALSFFWVIREVVFDYLLCSYEQWLNEAVLDHGEACEVMADVAHWLLLFGLSRLLYEVQLKFPLGKSLLPE